MTLSTFRTAMTLLSFTICTGVHADAPPAATSLATPPTVSQSSTPSVQQLDASVLVFETPKCGYCRLVRENIIPVYWQAPESERLPMQVIDIQSLGTAGHVLKAPIKTTPTFVFMKDGSEVHRITGYPGRENFFAVVNWILKQPANSKFGSPPRITTQIGK